jgi:hypothetical protein
MALMNRTNDTKEVGGASRSALVKRAGHSVPPPAPAPDIPHPLDELPPEVGKISRISHKTVENSREACNVGEVDVASAPPLRRAKKRATSG